MDKRPLLTDEWMPFSFNDEHLVNRNKNNSGVGDTSPPKQLWLHFIYLLGCVILFGLFVLYASTHSTVRQNNDDRDEFSGNSYLEKYLPRKPFSSVFVFLFSSLPKDVNKEYLESPNLQDQEIKTTKSGSSIDVNLKALLKEHEELQTEALKSVTTSSVPSSSENQQDKQQYMQKVMHTK